MLIYATPDDLANWVPSSTTLPDDAKQLLRSASVLVARAVNESPYEITVVSDAGTEAKRDATCAQVAAWLASGIRPGAGGLETGPVLKAKSIGTRKFEYDTNRTASAEALAKREQIAEDLAPEAEAILRAAGILWVPVATLAVGMTEYRAPLTEQPYGLVQPDWWRF